MDLWHVWEVSSIRTHPPGFLHLPKRSWLRDHSPEVDEVRWWEVVGGAATAGKQGTLCVFGG